MDETDETDVEVSEVTEPLPDLPVAVAVDASANVVGANVVGANAATPESFAAAEAVKEDIRKEIEEYKKTTDLMSPSKLSFSDDDTHVDIIGNRSVVNSPKDDKNLEELEKVRALTRDDEEDDDDDERLTIGDNVTLDIIDINDLNKAAAKVELKPPVLDFEVLT